MNKKCIDWLHRLRKQSRRGYVNTEYWRNAVADRVTQERWICRTCATVVSPWKTVHSTYLTGLTMPSDMMERFERNGEIWGI